MTDKPTSPGIWTRDGKFYRVWHDGLHDRIQHIDAHNGFSGDHNYLENAPPGNWRKLTAEPVPCEAAKAEFAAFLHALEFAGEISFASIKLISDKAAEIFAGVQKSIPLERHYKKAAKDIGDLFCWCVTHLTKFPPGPDVEWLDDVKRRLSERDALRAAAEAASSEMYTVLTETTSATSPLVLIVSIRKIQKQLATALEQMSESV